MQIRSQMLGAIAVSAALGLGSTVAVIVSARRDDAASVAQASAQAMARELTGLLALTQAYALHGEASAAEQWHQRQRAMASALALTATQGQDDRTFVALADINELRALAQELPPLFRRLESVQVKEADAAHNDSGNDSRSDARNDLRNSARGDVRESAPQRRRAALIDQLLVNTQAMADGAYRWSQSAAEARRRASRQFQAVAIATPLLMLAMLLWVGDILRRGVLPPLQRLQRAAAAIGQGDLSSRIGSEAANELGDLSRQFDAMTAALVASYAKLHRSETQLRTITDKLPALVVHVDTGQRYTFANEHAARLFDVPTGAIVGRTVREVRGEVFYAELEAHILRALSGEVVSFEASTMIGQRVFHYHSSYVPDIDETGDVRGYFAMTFDLTARREAELAVARSEQRLIDLTNSIPAMVAYFDMAQHCQYANDTCLAALGLERGDLAGLTLRAALGEAHFAQHEPFVREALAGRRARLETRLRLGERDAHFQAHLIPDRETGGAQRGFYLMTFDITALKEAQARQAQVERQLRAVADNLPALIAYIDSDERYTFLNRTYLDWWGVDPAALRGRKVADVLGPALYEQRRDQIQRALAGERMSFEVESTARDTARTLQTVYTPDLQPDGSVAGIYAISIDVSAQKRVERQLNQLVRADVLTGLANRYQFNEALPLALARSVRNGTALALMFLDIDHFKKINDTRGHGTGDAALKEFALRLLRSVRTTDTVARLGGDEFVVILEGLHNEAEPRAVAAKILADIAHPFELDGGPLAVSTSVGIAYQPPLEVDPELLLARADEALYEAKQGGRNRYHVSAWSVTA